MELKNGNKEPIFFFSKLGRNIGKENLVLYRWSQRNKNKRPSSVSSFKERLKFLYNIKKINVDKKEDDNENNIFSVEEKELQKLEEFANNIEKKQSFENTKKLRNNKNFQKKRLGFESHKSYFNKEKENTNKIPPSCTKYNPKYDIILKRTVSPPSWRSMQGRKNDIKKDDSIFSIGHGLIQDNMAGKSFIDFSKQTPRKNCFNIFDDKDKNDLYIIDLSKISKNKSLVNSRRELFSNNKNNKKQIIKLINDYKSGKNIPRKSSKDITQDNEETTKSNDSFDLFRHIYTKKLKKKNRKKNTSKINHKKIKSIDFNQLISREDLEEAKNKNISIVPYLFPNFSFIRDRPLMMAIYDTRKHKKNKNNSLFNAAQFNTIDYDKNKKTGHGPNFDFMNSRIYDEKDPYPSYMKRIFNKSATFKMMDKSLKENNYSERGFIMPPSSFFKNDSFNKDINLKILKSQKYLINSFMNNDSNERKYKESLKFYKNNYKYLMKEKNILSEIDEDINIEMKNHRNKSLNNSVK